MMKQFTLAKGKMSSKNMTNKHGTEIKEKNRQTKFYATKTKHSPSTQESTYLLNFSGT